MLSYWVMHQTSVVYFTPPALTLSFWLSIFVPFYALLALRDLFFLGPLHSRLHTPRLWRLHKLHHEPIKSAQSLHAFHIDLLDLIIENVGAPFLLFGLQLALGYSVGPVVRGHPCAAAPALRGSAVIPKAFENPSGDSRGYYAS